MARPKQSANVPTVTVEPELLSAREREVLKLLAHGHTNREVAERLYISMRTAEWYRASIRRKLSIRSRAGLVEFAVANGLAQLGP